MAGVTGHSFYHEREIESRNPRLLVGLAAMAAAIGIVPGIVSGLVGSAIQVAAKVAGALR
jgi:hypothetical protein